MWTCYLYAAITASTPLGKLFLEPAGIWSPSDTVTSMRSTTVLGIKVQLAVGRLKQLDGWGWSQGSVLKSWKSLHNGLDTTFPKLQYWKRLHTMPQQYNRKPELSGTLKCQETQFLARFQFPQTTGWSSELDCCWVQLPLFYADNGLFGFQLCDSPASKNSHIGGCFARACPLLSKMYIFSFNIRISQNLNWETVKISPL